MRILGISAFYHDSAAALVDDGQIVAAAQEERFTRKKHDSRFPRNAVAYCLEEAGIKLEQVEHVVFYDTVPEIRTPARNLPSLRTPRVPFVSHGTAGVDKGKAISETVVAAGARTLCTGI